MTRSSSDSFIGLPDISPKSTFTWVPSMEYHGWGCIHVLGGGEDDYVGRTNIKKVIGVAFNKGRVGWEYYVEDKWEFLWSWSEVDNVIRAIDGSQLGIVNNSIYDILKLSSDPSSELFKTLAVDETGNIIDENADFAPI